MPVTLKLLPVKGSNLDKGNRQKNKKQDQAGIFVQDRQTGDPAPVIFAAGPKLKVFRICFLVFMATSGLSLQYIFYRLIRA